LSAAEIISAQQLDLLKELANIGVGNAVTSLSIMLSDQKIHMRVPEVRVTVLQDVPESLGDPEKAVAATYCQAESELFGLIVLFVLPLKSAENMVIKLMPGVSGELGEMERSVLMELGNIITGSYLSALSFMTGLTFNATPPSLAIDMAGAVFGSVIAETATEEDYLILLKTMVEIEEEEIEGSVLILPDSGSLPMLFDHLK
jgi:chemotaxis protein CheC